MSLKYIFPCGCEWPIIEDTPPEGVVPLLDFDVEKAPEDCPATWAMLGKGLTKGVFQLESSLGKTWTKKLKPENAEHITALGAILRPGCLRAVDEEGISMTQHYCRRKNNEEETKPYHPAIDAILFPTYNVLAYQEQAMAIAQAVAGFNLQEADVLRKAIGKKLPEEMAKCKKMFLEGAKKAGIITDEMAEEVFGWIEKSQRYSFNKCVAGDEVIRRPNGGRYMTHHGYTVERMYRIRHDKEFAFQHGHMSLHRKWNRLGHYGRGLSQGSDGRIRPNIIRDIQPAGRRRVYRVVLSNGSCIRVTDNHKFPTSRGELTVAKMADFINFWEDQRPLRLFICGEYEATDFRKANRFSSMSREEVRAQSDGKAVYGRFREDNVAYTNGSFTEFKANAATIPMVCEDCGATSGRLELHHRNKNRADSSKDNLGRLCSSCHKKRDYALGRTKRGEKGYPSVEVTIEAIVPDGECETYDVTMDGPNHNFVVGGSDIVTCNSHSCCYGLTGYDSAYIKAHFPVAFFTSWLYNARHKQDPQQEVFELVNDARLFDITIEPPDLRTLEPHFHTDRKVVKFGLTNIKGVGESQIDKMRDAVKAVESIIGKPLDAWSWLDFLLFCSGRLSTAVVSRLIEVGALRWLNLPRQVMLAEFRAWSSLTLKEQEWLQKEELDLRVRGETCDGPGSFCQLIVALSHAARPKKEGGACANKNRVSILQSQIALLENPPTPLADSPHWIAYNEEELLGISISCTKIDACDISQVNVTCKEYLAGRTGFLMFGVEIQAVREVKTRKGKTPGQKMAFLTIADGSCCLDDVVCFPDVYKEYRHILAEGNTVILQGERDSKKDSSTLMVKKVWQANQVG